MIKADDFEKLKPGDIILCLTNFNLGYIVETTQDENGVTTCIGLKWGLFNRATLPYRLDKLMFTAAFDQKPNYFFIDEKQLLALRLKHPEIEENHDPR